MPLDVRFEHELGQLQKDLKKLEKQAVLPAITRSINRTAVSVRSVAVKEVSRQTGYKQKDVRDDLFIKKANFKSQEAFVDARAGRARNLIRFVSPAAKQPAAGPGKPQRFRRRSKAKHRRYLRPGVQANAWRLRKDYRGTFIVKGRNNNVIVVKRTSNTRRAKLKGVVGPSIRETFRSTAVTQGLRRTVNKRLPIELNRAIEFQLRRVRRR